MIVTRLTDHGARRFMECEHSGPTSPALCYDCFTAHLQEFERILRASLENPK